MHGCRSVLSMFSTPIEESFRMNDAAAVRPSHVVQRVQDLPTAVAAFEQAGFAVQWGSEPSHAHNALIYFEQGPFLELVNPLSIGLRGALMRQVARIGRLLGEPGLTRLDGWVRSDGFCDHALEVDVPMTQALSQLNSRGVALSKPRPFSRTQPDGIRLDWSLVAPLDTTLPFIMDPYRPSLPRPDSHMAHPNGVRRCEALTVETLDPTSLARTLAAMISSASVEVHSDKTSSVVADGFRYEVQAGPRHRLVSLTLDCLPCDDGPLGIRFQSASQ